MWMIICRYHRDDNAANDKTFKFQLAFSIIICLIPINAIYSITLWKDVLFSYFLMFLCFLAKVMIDKEGKVDYKFIILLSLIMAFIAEMRGNGFYLALIAMIIYSIYLFRKNNPKLSALLPILTITFILLISSLNIAYDVEDNEKDVLMIKTSHMLADYDLNLDIEDADRDKIHILLDKDKIGKNYKPTLSDPISGVINYTAMENDKITYIELAIKYSLKNPLHCLKYLFESSPMVWNIIKGSDWHGRPYYMNAEEDALQGNFEFYYGSHNFTSTQPYENISYANWGNPVFDAFNSLSLEIEGSILDTFLNSPALYMYLSIIILIMIQFITKSREIWLMYIPNLLNILIIFFSTPIQDYRYLYANLLVCYMLIIILIGLNQQNDAAKKSILK